MRAPKDRNDPATRCSRYPYLCAYILFSYCSEAHTRGGILHFKTASPAGSGQTRTGGQSKDRWGVMVANGTAVLRTASVAVSGSLSGAGLKRRREGGNDCSNGLESWPTGMERWVGELVNGAAGKGTRPTAPGGLPEVAVERGPNYKTPRPGSLSHGGENSSARVALGGHSPNHSAHLNGGRHGRI